MGQEAIDDANDVIKISSTDFQFNAINKQIRNVANPTSNQDVATKHYLENTFLTTANKTALTTINANISNIIAVNNNATNINSAVSNSTNINLVANNIGSVNTVATDIAKVIEVANDLQEAVSEVETVADDLNEATSEIDTVAVNIANVNLVGNSISNVNALAPKVTELGLLGTSAVVTDLGILGTSANVTAMGHLGTSANVTAMGLLGTSAVVTDMGLLGTSANVTAMGLLGNSTVISNISTVSSKNTEIGLLGTSANVTAMGHLGTSANVTAMGLLGTSSVVTDMGILGTSSNVTNMSTLAGISGLSTLASNNANITAVAGKVTEIGLLGTSANVTNMATLGTSTNVSNMSTLAGITNLNNLANAHASVTSVANNLASVNAFGETYRIASSAPTTSLNSGDLYFNTSTNVLNVYGASGWQNAGSSVNGTSERFKFVASGTPTTLTGNDANGNTLAYDAGFIDVYLNGIKMVNGTDVTVTSGSSIVFASALTNGDIVEAVTFGTFSVANLNASNLTSGTVPDARITGAYTGITSLSLDASGEPSADGMLLLQANSSSRQLRISPPSNASNGKIDYRGGNLTFQDDGTEVARFQGTTGFGIGVSAPTTRLDVDLSGTGETVPIVLSNRNTTAGTGQKTTLGFGLARNSGAFKSQAGTIEVGREQDWTSADNNIDSYMAFSTYLNNAGTEKVRIHSSGKVSIGTSTAEGILKLDNTGQTSETLLTLEDTGGSGAHSQITLKNTTGTVASLLTTSDNLEFRVDDATVFSNISGSEKLRINSSGNLLIGKTTEDLDSTAGHFLRNDGFINCTRSGGNVTDFNRLSSDGEIVRLSKDGTTVGRIGARGGNLYVGNGDVALKYSGTNDAIFPSTAVDGAGRDNAIDLGASGTRFKDIYLSGGAFIGGTGTANKLEDYEEGSWTPVIGGATGVTNLSGKYTKVGNLVTVWLYMLNGNIGGSPNNEITGLPFTVNEVRSTTSSVGAYDAFSADAQTVYGLAVVNDTKIYMNRNTDSASWITRSFKTSSGAYIHFSLSYISN